MGIYKGKQYEDYFCFLARIFKKPGKGRADPQFIQLQTRSC